MKLMKYALALAIAFLAITGVSNAQAFIGGGSSALALELGQAAIVAVGTAHGGAFCVYSRKSANQNAGTTLNAQDNRVYPAATTEKGDVWVVWGPTAGNCANPDLANPYYMYTNLDSVLGDRGYFEVDPGNATGCAAGSGYCQQMILAGGDLVLPGDNILNANTPAAPYNNMADNAPIPAALVAALHNKHWNWAGTDIRPEDALFATFRALSACNSWIARQPFDVVVRYTQGLGYANGNSFTSDFIDPPALTAKTFHLKNFAISGNDPSPSGGAVPGYATTPVGAQPIMVAVAPDVVVSPTGIALATDIPGYVAANFFDGTLVRASDLLGGADNWAVSALVREPLSGTYNTFEYGAINNSQFHTSQDYANCAVGGAPGNPLHIVSGNGASLEGGTAQGFRRRVIGTAEMVLQLGNATAADERIGYFFWSAANVASNATHVKYLKYNGVDPLTHNYSTGGILPGSNANWGPAGVDPCAGNIVNCPAGTITFEGLNNGDYALWSALRVVSATPVPAGITALISGAQTLNSTSTDFVTLHNLNVWRSHFPMNAIGVVAAANGPTIDPTANAGLGGDLCVVGTPGANSALAQTGGDVGGAIILKKANLDFCADFANTTGLINKTE